MDINFKERFLRLLSGRKPTIWAKKLGITQNTASRMANGHMSGPDVLRRIIRFENASMSWLIDGEGPPFYVNCFVDEAAFLESLRLHLEDDEHTKLYVLDSEIAPVIIFSTNATMEPEGKSPLPYLDLTVISGPWTPKSRSFVGMLEHEPRTILRRLPDKDTRTIREGNAGTFLIFGDEIHKGILDQPDLRTPQKAIIGEQSSPYNEIKIDLMRKAIIVVENVSASMQVEFSADQKATAIAAVYRYAEKTGAEDKLIDSSLAESIIEALV